MAFKIKTMVVVYLSLTFFLVGICYVPYFLYLYNGDCNSNYIINKCQKQT